MHLSPIASPLVFLARVTLVASGTPTVAKTPTAKHGKVLKALKQAVKGKGLKVQKVAGSVRKGRFPVAFTRLGEVCNLAEPEECKKAPKPYVALMSKDSKGAIKVLGHAPIPTS